MIVFVAMLGLASLLVVGGAGALWFRRAMALRIPRDRTAFVVAWSAGALLAVAALASGPGWLGGIAAGLALVGAGFLLFTVAISRQVVGPGAIRVGSALPDFEAPDDGGATFALSSLAGGPLLLKFFRGHW